MKTRLVFIGFCISLQVWGQNFIANGHFEFGGLGTGFSVNGQGYTNLIPPFLGTTQPGDFAITNNPQPLNNAFFLPFSDHTSGQGNMLIVDGGSIGGNQPFWQAGNNGGGVCGLTPGSA